MIDNLTIIIPFYEGHAYIGNLLADLPAGLPVIVVDDGSKEPLAQPSRPATTLYRPERKLYFTGAVNYAIRRCSTDVLILNQDVRLAGDDWLQLIDENRGRYALIGERIRGTHPAFPHGYVHGVFQFMRRDAIEAAGIMDAGNYPLWGASALWQWQICRKGFEALPVETIPGLTHQRDGNFGSSIQKLLKEEPANRALLIRTPPAISVVIPSFNHGRYLPDAINSLIGGPTSLGDHPGQSFKSFEVIIVDDGSSDDTPAIAKQWSEWQGIRYIRQQNAGTPSANNAGIKAAAGKYIVMMCADDMREPWSLQDLYDAITRNPGRVIYDEPTVFGKGARGPVWPLANYDFDLLLSKNMMHMGICFEREAWVKAGGYPEVMRHGREDWAFNIALGRQGYCGLKIDRSGYLYRREGQNRTLSNTTADWRQSFLVQLHELYPREYRGERMAGCCGQSSSGPAEAPAARAAQTSARSLSAIMPAAPSGDMVLVQYQGTSIGSMTWGGAGATPSGRAYRFGKNPKDRVKYVEAQDLQWFLGRREGGADLFQLYEMPKPPEEAPINEPMLQETSDIDPATLTVDEIRALELTPEQWAALAELEQAGKARKGVLEYADAQSA